MKRRTHTSDTPVVRCAIYTRKSTDEGLDREFNTLDAQREAAEAFVLSQKHDGWSAIPDHYDDGGFTGGNMDRPALARLLADIEAGRVDCVVVYKVDRLSRSLLDFARMVAVFEEHGVSFVSVTQDFNTTTSMGRLTLNILLSFAQFEREIISERTRDKMAAARRKGKFIGGRPVLGYDVQDRRLVVNDVEAERVRAIFALYLEHKALLPTVREINRRGWTTKAWTTKKDKPRGGKRFTKTNLYQLLTNVLFVGHVRHKDEVYNGEHDGIVPEPTFQEVQRTLVGNGRNGGADVRNRSNALLRGLLRCDTCGCAMSHTYSQRGPKRYRYYVCVNAQKQGWSVCPGPSLPAGEIERFVVDQIREIGRDPALVAATLARARGTAEEAIGALVAERAALRRQLGRDEGLLRDAVGDPDRLAELDDRLGRAERRLSEIGVELAGLEDQRIGEGEVASALADFDGMWEGTPTHERRRLLELLIERIGWHGERSDVSIDFRPSGIRCLGEEVPA